MIRIAREDNGDIYVNSVTSAMNYFINQGTENFHIRYRYQYYAFTQELFRRAWRQDDEVELAEVADDSEGDYIERYRVVQEHVLVIKRRKRK